MNIVEVAKNRDAIMASQDTCCPNCGMKQFAPFDRLYTQAYDICLDCSTDEEIAQNSENIFAIIEA